MVLETFIPDRIRNQYSEKTITAVGCVLAEIGRVDDSSQQITWMADGTRGGCA
ncbi:hypothetical protein SAMN04489842_4012 [Natronobacterium texcoconense]|uniref:Uncharacterized protein n=1 Tax=Natronobacterium texcoconense TaxID=1095778 RepID=A0A1H1J1G7_NATTX|nr:hypothetical protein SAMN04489842_4012 [Natronobacterium texcoconense]